MSARSSSCTSKPPVRVTTEEPSACTPASSGGASRLSVTAMRKPLRCKWRATDRPVRPMPTTTAFGAVCAACGFI